MQTSTYHLEDKMSLILKRLTLDVGTCGCGGTHAYITNTPRCKYHVKKNNWNTSEYIPISKNVAERTANGRCRTEIARPKGTVVSLFGMQKQ